MGQGLQRQGLLLLALFMATQTFNGRPEMHFFFLGGASYMDGSHELSDPKVRAEAPGNLADRNSPWAQQRPHSATAIGRQAQLA
jgi:hypothetical protein